DRVARRGRVVVESNYTWRSSVTQRPRRAPSMADNDTNSENTQARTPDDPHAAERFRADALRGNVVKPDEDPFDPARLRITVDPASAVATRTITFTVPVRSRPDPHTFFRVHPEWYFDAYLLELKEQREVYLLAPELA